MSAELEAVEGQIIEDILRMMVPVDLLEAETEVMTPLFREEAAEEEQVMSTVMVRRLSIQAEPEKLAYVG